MEKEEKDDLGFEEWFKDIESSALCWNRKEGLLTAWRSCIEKNVKPLREEIERLNVKITELEQDALRFPTLSEFSNLQEDHARLESELAKFQHEHVEAVDELQGWGPEDSLRIVIRRMKVKIEDQARELARLREGE